MSFFRWSRLALPLVLSLAVACGSDETKLDDDPTEEPGPTTDDGNTTPPNGNGDGDGNGDGNGNGNGNGTEEPASKVATIRVHYPVGSKTLLLTGSAAPLTSAGTPLTDLSNDTWELSLGEIEAPVSFTPTLDGKPARGPAYSVAPGQTLDVYPHFNATAGKTSLLPNFKSKILNNTRDLRLYLPPSYEENTAARYPVIYMHDGQVIFEKDLGLLDGAAKNFFGTWKTETAIDKGVEDGTLPEIIIVGVDIIITINPLNPLADLTKIREQELTPTKDDDNPMKRQDTGKGPLYLKMIVEEIKPNIDKLYRTFPDREHTFIGGSSLGGLISMWAGLEHGDVFGGILAMSSSTWWQEEIVTKRIAAENGGPKKTLKVYTDVGGNESGQDSAEAKAFDLKFVEENQRTWKAYADAGYVEGKTLKSVLDPKGQHNGGSWSQRFPEALRFLAGSGR